MDQARLIGFSALKQRGVPFGRTWLWQLERDQKFPKRVRLGPTRVAWVAEEVDAWIRERIEARDAAIAA